MIRAKLVKKLKKIINTHNKFDIRKMIKKNYTEVTGRNKKKRSISMQDNYSQKNEET